MRLEEWNHESIFSDFYSNEDSCDEDDSYTSDNDCKYTYKFKLEEGMKIQANDMDMRAPTTAQ